MEDSIRGDRWSGGRRFDPVAGGDLVVSDNSMLHACAPMCATALIKARAAAAYDA